MNGTRLRARAAIGIVLALALPVAAAAQDAASPEEPAAAAITALPRNPPLPDALDRAAARAAADRALAYLVTTQHEDGSWASGSIDGVIDSHYSVASYYDWQVASCALANLALLEAPETPERRAALERGVRWLCTTRIPKRGSDWDNDTIWAGLYGVVACVEVVQDLRFQSREWRDMIEARGREFLDILVRNQVPLGGWGYYDDPPYSRRPKWATSFSTALVLPALSIAREIGWLDDGAVLDRSIAYVRRCHLPNGAYEYDLNPVPRAPAGEHINDVKGSLGRIQVCNWALVSCGDPSVTLDEVRLGLDRFFEHHRFLDVARMRPIPHEAYYANAGYFYLFGHYYAALAIGLLPAGEREAFHARLRPHLVKTQRRDGSSYDYLVQRYFAVAGTAFVALALEAGLEPTGPEPAAASPAPGAATGVLPAAPGDSGG